MTLLLVSAGAATALADSDLAQEAATVESRISGNLAGPVGLVAVLLGLGGLVLGLVRHRRAAQVEAMAAAAAATPVAEAATTVAEQLAGDSAAPATRAA
ncbi:hypothetical protein [Goodfellowiella coeruleoviolacea]|nr:hypothetical protein [Goodfellowiella coeruleoviolacea]